MDIRTEKTEKAIKNAFFELRSKKSIEKITIKELCLLARINKSTFYSHYDDIYDLSEKLQMETVAYVLSTISNAQQYSSAAFTRALFYALTTHTALINSLFSGKEQACLVERLEEGIKEMIYRKYPEYRNDPEKQILLTYSIYGGYYAYQKNQNIDQATLSRMLENISGALFRQSGKENS